MYLSKIEIQGFKSFANRATLMFERGITAIVGPNGSGKSNVADSVRWVLGEQSLKLLRGKRSEDVIFAGSDKKQRLGMAEVSMTLNNEDRRAGIEYSELVITRRVYRNGEGEYFINHQPARLQDIQLMLAQANFGQRTYSVIGQGMIDSFLISSPQERKHLFDEAAGVRQYQLKKEQALHKLEQSKENLAQGEAIMQEIEPHLRSLTRQVRRLERREEIDRELRQAQRSYFGLRSQQIEKEISALKTEHESAERRRDEIGHELTTIQGELEAIEHERTATETFADLQKQYNGILDEKNRFLEQQAVVKGRLEIVARQTGAAETAFLEKRVSELQHQCEALRDEAKEEERGLERKRQELQVAEQGLAKVDQAFKELQTRVTGIRAELERHVSLPEVHRSVSAWHNKYASLVEMLEAESFDIHGIRKSAQKLHAELRQIVDRMAGSQAETHAQSLADVQTELLGVANDRQSAYQRAAELRAEVQIRSARFDQYARDLARLEQELERLKKDEEITKLSAMHPDEAYAMAMREAKKIESAVADVDQRLKTAREQINSFNQLETTKKERLFALQKQFRAVQHEFNHAQNAVNELSVQLARLDQRHDDLRHEIQQAMGESGVTEIAEASRTTLEGDPELLAEDIGRLQHQIQLIGGIDESVTSEYKETNERWEFLSKQAEDLRSGIVSLESAIEELDGIISQRFDAAFRKINGEFNTYFRSLFRGGRAELILVKEVVRENEDLTEAELAMAQENGAAGKTDAATGSVGTPKEKEEKVITGIEIKATPPGKKLQSITMLSGGERALTSIALLCAIIANNPSPFVVLDEVDAALDEANSQRFAAILEQLAHKTQFVTITHNRATMEKAAILYGVTMGDDGVSQLLSVKMDEAERIIQQHGNR